MGPFVSETPPDGAVLRFFLSETRDFHTYRMLSREPEFLPNLIAPCSEVGELVLSGPRARFAARRAQISLLAYDCSLI